VGSIHVHSHFATPFSKEFNLAMLTVAAIAPPQWHGELSGTALANVRQIYMLRNGSC